MTASKKMSTRTMVTGALLTALVIALQYVSMAIRTGSFSITLALIPIVIGAITCGKGMGAWLGMVFGITVLATGDAAPFMVVNVPGTVITVLAKGIACGFVAGLVYEIVEKFISKPYMAGIISAITCPVINTGVFLLGCVTFFIKTVTEWAGGTNVGKYLILGSRVAIVAYPHNASRVPIVHNPLCMLPIALAGPGVCCAVFPSHC